MEWVVTPDVPGEAGIAGLFESALKGSSTETLIGHCTLPFELKVRAK